MGGRSLLKAAESLTSSEQKLHIMPKVVQNNNTPSATRKRKEASSPVNHDECTNDNKTTIIIADLIEYGSKVHLQRWRGMTLGGLFTESLLLRNAVEDDYDEYCEHRKRGNHESTRRATRRAYLLVHRLNDRVKNLHKYIYEYVRRHAGEVTHEFLDEQCRERKLHTNTDNEEENQKLNRVLLHDDFLRSNSHRKGQPPAENDDDDDDDDDDEGEEVEEEDDEDKGTSSSVFPPGTKVTKEFEDAGQMIPFNGEVESYDAKEKLYLIVYEDEDAEELTREEVSNILVRVNKHNVDDNEEEDDDNNPTSNELYRPSDDRTYDDGSEVGLNDGAGNSVVRTDIKMNNSPSGTRKRKEAASSAADHDNNNNGLSTKKKKKKKQSEICAEISDNEAGDNEGDGDVGKEEKGVKRQHSPLISTTKNEYSLAPATGKEDDVNQYEGEDNPQLEGITEETDLLDEKKKEDKDEHAQMICQKDAEFSALKSKLNEEQSVLTEQRQLVISQRASLDVLIGQKRLPKETCERQATELMETASQSESCAEDATEKLGRKDEEVNQLQSEVNEKDDEINELKSDVENMKSQYQIMKLRQKEVEAKNATIVDQIELKAKEISNLQAKNVEKDDVIARLKSNVERLKGEHLKRDAKEQEIAAELKVKTFNLQEKAKLASQYKTELELKAEEISNLQAKHVETDEVIAQLKSEAARHDSIMSQKDAELTKLRLSRLTRSSRTRQQNDSLATTCELGAAKKKIAELEAKLKGQEAKKKGEEDDANAKKNELRDALSGTVVMEKPNVTWDDVAGLSMAKRSLKETVIFPTRFPQLFTGKRRPFKGILLYGVSRRSLSHFYLTSCYRPEILYSSLLFPTFSLPERGSHI